LQKYKNSIDFGIILKVGENSDILKNMSWMRLKEGLRKDLWKKKIEN
jgi:hypothetical protein